ncbi:hypothetical protein H8959_006452 [Pygathrix nigripes]
MTHLFFRGTETSTTLCYGLLILLKYPEVAAPAKVQELDRVVGWRRAPSPDDHERLPYTNAVLLQIQRFISMVPLGQRRSPSTPSCTASLPKGAH